MSCTLDINRGFGERSWRYSALINNGIVEALFEENSDLKPDPTNSSVTNGTRVQTLGLALIHARGRPNAAGSNGNAVGKPAEPPSHIDRSGVGARDCRNIVASGHCPAEPTAQLFLMEIKKHR